MIQAKEYTQETIKKAYNRRGWLYSKTVAPMEWEYHLTALEKANIRSGEKVLEVAVGPGLSIVNLAQLVGPQTVVTGVDTSTGMLKLAENNLRAHGLSNYLLKEADSRQLPFPDASFDVLYNAYMLDLIPLQDMSRILSEFKRVLRPGGRLVLLNMSKEHAGASNSRETLYNWLPAWLVLYFMGGCRPVMMETAVREQGFQNVKRTYLGGKAPSEIVLATKPQ